MPEILPIYLHPYKVIPKPCTATHMPPFSVESNLITLLFFGLKGGCFVTKISETSNRKTMKYPD